MRFFRALAAFAAAFMLIAAPASANDLSGEWVGVSSGNHVMMEMRDGGFSVVFTGQQQSGQTGEPMFYRDAGSGTYIHTFDNGTNSTTQVLSPNKFRVTNSDGWTDEFRRLSALVAMQQLPPAPASPPVPIARATNDAAAAADGVKNVQAESALGQRLASINSKFDMSGDCAPPLTSEQCLIRFLTNAHKAAIEDREELENSKSSFTPNYYERRLKELNEAIDRGQENCEHLALNPADCVLSGSTSSRQPLPSRVIARDGRRALDCVRLEQLAQSSSSTSGGGSVLTNQCTDTVTIGWCSTGGECERGGGNITNVLAGHSWPVDANHEVRWGACHGANTLHGDPGSKGLQFTCSAPDAGG